MNEKKLKRLFAAARQAPAPAPPEEFAPEVLRAIRGEPPLSAWSSVSIWDHLNGLFPRIAVAAAAVIALCAVADWMSDAGAPGISEGVAQLASQFTFDPEDL